MHLYDGAEGYGADPLYRQWHDTDVAIWERVLAGLKRDTSKKNAKVQAVADAYMILRKYQGRLVMALNDDAFSASLPTRECNGDEPGFRCPPLTCTTE